MEAGDRVDRYRLIEPLGEGGQGSVWKAEDLLTHELRALKLVSIRGAPTQDLERARREGRSLAGLRHPSLTRCYSIFEDLDRAVLGLVLELVDGTSLDQALYDPRRTREHCAHALRHVAAALEHLHARGLVHRDLKPANVLVASEFWNAPEDPKHVRVADLGIAITADAVARLTIEGGVIGTPRYMAPEQLEPKRWAAAQPGPPIDIFAFGVMVWALLDGRHPTGLGRDATLGDYAMAYRDAERSARWPPALADVAWRTVAGNCLELRPTARYPSGARLVAALASFDASRLADRTIPSTPHPDVMAPAAHNTDKAAAAYPHHVVGPPAPTVIVREQSAVPRASSPKRSLPPWSLAALAGLALLAVVGVAVLVLRSGKEVDRAEESAKGDATERAFPPSRAKVPPPTPSVVASSSAPPEPAPARRAIVVPVCYQSALLKTAPLRKEPGRDTKIVDDLPRGREVILGGMSTTPKAPGKLDADQWYQVTVPADGPQGWLHASVLQTTTDDGLRVECFRCPADSAVCHERCLPSRWPGAYVFSESCRGSLPWDDDEHRTYRVQVRRLGDRLDVELKRTQGGKPQTLRGNGIEGCGRELVVLFEGDANGSARSKLARGDRLLTLVEDSAGFRVKWGGVKAKCSEDGAMFVKQR